MMYLRLLSLAIVVALTGCATPAEQKFPAVTHDGLKLQPHTTLRAVYLKPGADLSQYDSVAILKPYVAFSKNWQRNYNEQANFEARVSDKDMEEIRERGFSWRRTMLTTMTKVFHHLHQRATECHHHLEVLWGLVVMAVMAVVMGAFCPAHQHRLWLRMMLSSTCLLRV